MSDQDNQAFDNELKPKWAKIDSEVPFATKPISVEDTGEFKPLPWSEKNTNLQIENNTLIEDNTRFDSSLIAGEIKTETEEVETITETERKSVFNKFTEETPTLKVEEVKIENKTVIQNPVKEEAKEETAQTQIVEQTKEEATTPVAEKIELPQTDSITDTAATLPKIFNENATEETPAEFEAPIEINETETTMIRRRSLMGESRQKAEEGYDNTHVRLAWQPLKQEEEKTEEEKLETILEGATVYPTLPSRAAAHWWSIFLGILLLPLSWFFLNKGISDLAATRATSSLPIGMIEIAGASLAIFIFLLATQFSSLGAFIMGTITTIVGGLFLFLPQQTDKFFGPVVERATQMGGITEKIFKFFSTNAYNGTLFYFGIILFAVGFIAHTARRQGRREQQIRNDLGLVGVDDKIAKKARKAALKAEKAELKAEAKAKAKIENKK